MDRDKKVRNAQVIMILAFTVLLLISAYEVVNYGHEVKWTAKLEDDSYFQIKQVNDGTIYVYGSNSGISSYTPDGKLKWTYREAGWPVISDNGTAYFGRRPGYTPSDFNALSPDGQILWSYPVANGSFGIPLTGPDGNIYTLHFIWPYNLNQGSDFMAFSPQGNLIWKLPVLNGAGFAILHNGTVLLNTVDDNITAFSPGGSVLWKIQNGVSLFNTPTDGESAYQGIASSETNGISADLYATTLNGSLLWRYPYYVTNTTDNIGSLNVGTPFIDDRGMVYFIRYNGTGITPHESLFAMNPNGTLRWEYRDSTIGIPLIRNETIAVQTGSNLTIFDQNGYIKWKYSNLYFSGARPEIGNDGTVFAITASSEADSPPYSLVAIGMNPLFPLILVFVILPIIIICLVVIWKGKKE